MARRRSRARREVEGRGGFLVVDKPAGWTSHDVVDAARSWLGTPRVGHLGTLDPLATGVLPLAVREATKLVPFLQGGRKSYDATIRLGVETDTQDADGAVVREHAGPLPDRETLRRALAQFRGEIQQIPPMFSAVKRSGVPLYRLARRGLHVEREPKRVHIDRVELTHFSSPFARLELVCSAGTYVRTLAADLGARLGCGAHVTALRRLRSEPFGIDQAVSAALLRGEPGEGAYARSLVPPAEALGLPTLRMEGERARRVLHGGEIPAAGAAALPPGTRVAAVDRGGVLLAVLEVRADHRLRPLRVLQSVATPR